MVKKNRTKKIIYFIGIGIIGTPVILFLLSMPQNKKEVTLHPRGQQFAGSESCIRCHQDISTSFSETPHFKTSALASNESIVGSFAETKNTLHFNDHDRIEMTTTDSGFFQIGYSDQTFRGAQRIDIVVGSGSKGQTYLNWQGEKLFQLPASYYTPEHKWSTSPGNPTDRFVINRPIFAGCLNCHSTHFEVKATINKLPDYGRDGYLLGIQCERCHGPSANHISRTASESSENQIGGTINPAKLNRKQKLDLCAQCHSGNRSGLSTAFTFLPGDTLISNYMNPQVIDTTSGAEVHGSQYELLAASKCFKQSDLTCGSCHNPHKNEKGNLASFSAKCQSCHSSSKSSSKMCLLSGKLGASINQNCIDCHMPIKASRKITFRVNENKSLNSELARTHYISVYPTQSDKIISMLNKLSKK